MTHLQGVSLVPGGHLGDPVSRPAWGREAEASAVAQSPALRHVLGLQSSGEGSWLWSLPRLMRGAGVCMVRGALGLKWIEERGPGSP